MDAKERIAEEFAAVESVIDELTAEIAEKDEQIRTLISKAGSWDWEDWFAYVFLTFMAIAVTILTLCAVWFFIHWAAQQPQQPTSWCETGVNGTVCHQ